MSRDFASANPPEPEEKMRECDFCQGHGIIMVASRFPFNCGECAGTGLVPDDREPEPQFDTEEERDGKR